MRTSAAAVCKAFVVFTPSAELGEAFECELPLHHLGEHRGSAIAKSVADGPRSGRTHSETTVYLRWES